MAGLRLLSQWQFCNLCIHSFFHKHYTCNCFSHWWQVESCLHWRNLSLGNTVSPRERMTKTHILQVLPYRTIKVVHCDVLWGKTFLVTHLWTFFHIIEYYRSIWSVRIDAFTLKWAFTIPAPLSFTEHTVRNTSSIITGTRRKQCAFGRWRFIIKVATVWARS